MIVSQDGKHCSKCKLFKPFEDFVKDNRSKKNGFAAICLECNRIRNEEARREKGVKPAFNLSSINTENLPEFDTSKYYLGRLCKNGHDYKGSGFTLRNTAKGDCPKCKSLAALECRRNWKDKDPEGYSDYFRLRRWLECPRVSPTVAELVVDEEVRHRKHEQSRIDYARRSAEDYVFRYRNDEDFRQAEKNRVRAYKYSNPSKVKHWAISRWDKILGQSDGTVTKEVINEIIANAVNCLYCDRQLSRRTATIDHIVPINQGGGNSANNLIACCRSCNSAKGDLLPHEWSARLNLPNQLKFLRLVVERGLT